MLLSAAQIIFCFLALITVSFAQEISLKNKFKTGDFKLADKTGAADIFVSENDFKVAQIAARDFAADVERVSGKKPQIKNQATNLSKSVVIIGTIGKSEAIENLIKSGKIDVSPIKNKWENFLIATVQNPLSDVRNALVIVGSDRRGRLSAFMKCRGRLASRPGFGGLMSRPNGGKI